MLNILASVFCYDIWFYISHIILHEFLSAEEKIFTPHSTEEYSIALKKYGEDNKKTANWYKNAIDHKGNKIGKHENR